MILFQSLTSLSLISCWIDVPSWIQLFREWLSDKVHATTPKCIVGGLEFTVFQTNLKEWQERPRTYVCECYRTVTKLGSTATVSGTMYWLYPILPFGIVTCTFFPTTFLEIAIYPNRKALLHSMTKVFGISSNTVKSDIMRQLKRYQDHIHHNHYTL